MDKQEIEALIDKKLAERSPLPFPLDTRTLTSLRSGGFLAFGTTTLTAGAATIEDPRIQPSSKAFVSYKTFDNPGSLRAECSAGQIDIESTDNTDVSEVTYLIIL